MPLPSIYETALEHLFSDEDKMLKAGLPKATVGHLVRLRSAYSLWLRFPSKRDREIVGFLMQQGVGQSTAYEDLRVLKMLLGELQRTSKDFHRYKVLRMLDAAYEKASASGNTRDMVAAADKMGKYTQLDKEDQRDRGYDKIIPQVFVFTDDPAVIGLERMPNFREKIRKAKQDYWIEDTELIEAEDVDARLDDIFKPKFLVNGLD